MTTATIPATHPLEWTTDQWIAAGRQQGLEHLRTAYRIAVAIVQDPSPKSTPEVKAQAKATRQRIVNAAEQIKHEAIERQYHVDMQASERAEDEAVAAHKAQRDGATARRMINGQMVEIPMAARPAVAHKAQRDELPNLPHAHYAVEHEGVLKFYRVDKPQEGRWTGYTFVKVQASDEYYPIKAAARRTEIIDLILAAGPQAAMERYGREIGRCGHCHRTLTNPESLARGIGPICASRMGW